MKRDQKKSNNKGFSLVELIVVIAIMAVLMGVLAPTLIGNVEKSRESTDLQNLDSIRGAVQAAMASEAGVKLLGGNSATVTLAWNSSTKKNDVTVSSGGVTVGTTTLQSYLQTELDESLTESVSTKSSAASGGTVTVNISSLGAVEVCIVKDGNVVQCKKTKDDQGAFKDMKAGNIATGGATTAAAAG